MRLSPLTYVVHGQNVPDKDRLFSHLVVLNPRFIIVLDEPGLARELADRFPQCTVMFRWNGDGGDAGVFRRKAPQQWLSMMLGKLQGDRRIMLYTNNESGLPADLIQWLTELIPLANQLDVKLCCINLQTGNPQPEKRDDDGNIIKESEWEFAKSLLALLAVNRQHVLGLHEYAGAVITSGLYGGYPDNAGVEPGKPGGMNLIPRGNWPEDVSKVTRYHVGRFKFLLDYLDRQDIRHPRIVVTEHGFDDTSDIKRWLETLRRTSPYLNIRGWRSLVNQWMAWWPMLDTEHAYFEQIKWANETVYAGSPVEAQALFCWGNSGGWEQFDIANAHDLQDLLAAYANELEPLPEPIPTPHPVPPSPGDSRYEDALFETTGGNTILREYPTVTSRDLTRIVESVVRYIPAEKLTDDERHTDQLDDGTFAVWLPTLLGNLVGYVRADVVKISPRPTEPPEDEPPPLPPEVILKQDVAFLKALIKETEQELDPAREQLHHWTHVNARLVKRIDGLNLIITDLETFISKAVLTAHKESNYETNSLDPGRGFHAAHASAGPGGHTNSGADAH